MMATSSPNPTLTDQLYQTLKSQILDYKIWPGSRLVIADLAKEHGISPTPVRECIGKLVADGLVTNQPYRGAVVCQPTMEEFAATHDVRCALESLAGKLACEHLTEKELERLEQIMNEMQAAHEANDFEAWVKSDDHFHHLVMHASQNPTLIGMLQSIFDQLHRYRMATRACFPSYAPEGITEHRKILDAFYQHDAELAQQRSAEHVTQAWGRTEPAARAFFNHQS